MVVTPAIRTSEVLRASVEMVCGTADLREVERDARDAIWVEVVVMGWRESVVSREVSSWKEFQIPDSPALL